MPSCASGIAEWCSCSSPKKLPCPSVLHDTPPPPWCPQVQDLPLHFQDKTLLLPVVVEHTVDERSPLYGEPLAVVVAAAAASCVGLHACSRPIVLTLCNVLHLDWLVGPSPHHLQAWLVGTTYCSTSV
jgi:hypothetical protein